MSSRRSGSGRRAIARARRKSVMLSDDLALYHVGLRTGGVRVARSSTSFQPGTSGNPGGRPKGLSEVIALAREHTELAITTLVDIAKQTKAAPAARVAAASALLDRGWGKPAQAIEATTTNVSAVVMLGKGDPVEIAEHYRRLMDGTLVGDNDS